MRILVVTHYFPPEIGAPQARLSELASAWVEAGEEVTVLTGMPNHPTGIVPPAYRGRLRADERVDGYRVVRTWLYATPNEGIVKKSLGHLSFMVSSVLLAGGRSGPADVVVVSSPTFLSIFGAWLLARRKQAAFVVEVRDLWPAIFVELGILRDPRLIRVLERLELAAYRAADAVVVVTEGFRDNLLSRGVPAAKIHVVRNGADLDRFTPGTSDRSHRTAGDVTVLYVGAHGISHGLDVIVDAAARLTGEAISFTMVGEGAAKAKLAARVAALALPNLTLRPGVPRDQVPGLLAAADICVVPLRDVELFRAFVPSKMFEMLAAGNAVIGALRGEAADLLCAAGGVVVEPEDAVALAEAILSLARDPDRRAAMGRQGRAWVTANLDRRELAGLYRDVLAGLLSPAQA